MEPHGQSPWYLHENTLLRQGFGGLSASGEIRRSSAAHRHRMFWARLTHSATGKARGLLRRRIKFTPFLTNLVLAEPRVFYGKVAAAEFFAIQVKGDDGRASVLGMGQKKEIHNQSL
jgi:hypothetical protein